MSLEGVSTDTLRQTVQDWLQALGCTPVEQPDPSVQWHYRIDYPPKSPHVMHVVAPKELANAVMIVSATDLSPENLKAFQALDEDERESFLWKLRTALNQIDVEFRLDGAATATDCPHRLQVSTVRYTDGLSMDSFARSVGAVFKVELGGLYVVHQHLGGNHGPTQGGRFDFKRLGY